MPGKRKTKAKTRKRRPLTKKKEFTALQEEYARGKAFDEVSAAAHALYVASQRPPLSSFIQYDGRGEIPPNPEPISPPPHEPCVSDAIGGVLALAGWLALVGITVYFLW